jgi:ubiquinone/menaquinone biosynthesis C-methylase UbiE
MEPVSGQFQHEHSARAARTYTAAADHYLSPALGFWDRWGAATVARVPLSSGDAVLDVCCGAGASALPAARAVGPSGSVLGLDLAEPLLALARQRAANLGLTNVSFRECDATASGLESGSFDAVVCVFGVFFAANMPGFVAEMWRLVRPGGTLAITTSSSGLRTSGRSCSGPAIAPLSTRSATSSGSGFVSAWSASSARAALQGCGTTWCLRVQGSANHVRKASASATAAQPPARAVRARPDRRVASRHRSRLLSGRQSGYRGESGDRPAPRQPKVFVGSTTAVGRPDACLRAGS